MPAAVVVTGGRAVFARGLMQLATFGLFAGVYIALCLGAPGVLA